LEKISLKQCTSEIEEQGRALCAATSCRPRAACYVPRLCAAGPRRPRPHAPPKAERRPRTCTTRGPASRCSPSPETPQPASPVCRTRAVRAADPRSIRGDGRTRAGRGAVARRDTLVLTPPSYRAALYKGRRVSPLPHTTPRC
jgi:hypothetical protein